MRRLAAISLLSLHLFSMVAPLLMHAIAVFHSNRFFEKQIAEGLYNKTDLTEIRIPANIPGLSEQSYYQDLFGEIRFKNTAYNYVKIKMTRDAIYLLCVPNYSTTRLCGQNIIDARAIPDIPINKKNHVPFEKAFYLSVFKGPAGHFHFILPEKAMPRLLGKNTNEVIESSITSPGQPPEAV